MCDQLEDICDKITVYLIGFYGKGNGQTLTLIDALEEKNAKIELFGNSFLVCFASMPI